MERAHGIDVSHWKPVKSWQAVYDSGVRFAGIKATEGNTFRDPKFREHRGGLRTQPFSLGIFYHFARSGSPRKQAEHLMDTAGALRENERLCLDLEVSPTPNPSAAIGWLDAFFETLMDGACSDRRPILYTSKRIWRQIDDPSWDLASEIDLWAPRYNTAGVEPALPRPWAKHGWTFWQWTDGEFPEHVTPGVGKCDANWFRGDEQALKEYARFGPPSPSSSVA